VTRYTFEHAEVRIFWRGPFAIVEVRHRAAKVPKGTPPPEPEPWLELAQLSREPSMGEVQRAITGTIWESPPDE
jgi:hypothetical protein